MPAPRKPETIPEFRRLAHAFLGGSRFASGSTVYVVMSTTAPLYRVQGIYETQAEAESVISHHVDPRLGWAKAEEDGRAVYDVTVPHLPFSNDVLVITKDEWTGEQCALPTPPIRSADDRPPFREIESMELRINWSGRTTTYAIPATSIAVFITRGAAEMFLYPHYADTYGHEYAETLRAAITRMDPAK